ncbi:MAG: hypothetical protein OES32_07820 [Acidobacteriota bacterium]|nr:hypothetical protein [Acidobacteriota bacterium]
MIDIGDWLWLGIAVLWVVLRVLPRLFRGGKQAAKTPEQRPERHAKLDAAEAEGGDSYGPGPIVPR